MSTESDLGAEREVVKVFFFCVSGGNYTLFGVIWEMVEEQASIVAEGVLSSNMISVASNKQT